MNINKKECTQCNLCLEICIAKAIDIDTYYIDKNKCNNCLHCLAICPNEAISYKNKISSSLSNYNIPGENFENFVFSKRSHRFFLNKKVPSDILLKIANLLRFSPSGTNTQQVYITILGSKEKVKTVSTKIMKYFIFISNTFLNFLFFPVLFLFLGKAKTIRLHKMKPYLKRYSKNDDILTYNAPALFIFHAPKSSSTPEQDCTIWSTIGTLYAETLGLATCFNGFIVYGINYNRSIKNSLKIPKNHKVYSTFLLGYPKFKFKKKVFRENAKINLIS